MHSEIASVVTYATYVTGTQLLTDVRRTNGQNLLLTIIVKVFQSTIRKEQHMTFIGPKPPSQDEPLKLPPLPSDGPHTHK